MVISADEKIVYINKRGAEMLGYSRTEILGKNWFLNFLPKDISKNIHQVYKDLMKGKGEFVEYYENPIVNLLGEQRIIRWHNTVLRDKEGKIIGTISSGRDITEQKAEETRRREIEEKYRLTINYLADVIYVIDKNYRIILVNKACKKLLKELNMPTEVEDKNLFEVFGFFGEKFKEQYDKVFAEGKTIVTEEETALEDREFYTETRRIPVIEDKQVKQIITLMRDITSSKSSERLLHQRNYDLHLINLINESINKGESLFDILQKFCRKMSDLFAYQIIGILLVDRNRDILALESIAFKQSLKGEVESLVGKELPDIRIGIKKGTLLSGILQGQKHEKVSGYDNILRIIGENIDIARYQQVTNKLLKTLDIKSIMLMPLVSEGKTIGLLGAASDDKFTKSDVKRMLSISSRLSAAVQRKLYEVELQDSRRKFEDIAFSSADWVWESDNEGRYKSAIGRVKEILGYGQKELLDKTPFDFMEQEEGERVKRIYTDLASKKEPIVNLENWVIAKDGRQLCLLTNGVPVFDDEGNLIGYRGVNKNITPRKISEDEMEKRTDELERLNKLMIGREIRMRELKDEIDRLKSEKSIIA